MECPVCEYQWPEGTPVCLRCEYDFTNSDARRALGLLRRQNAAGNTMWFVGTALIFFSFAALFGLAPAIGAVIAWGQLVSGALLVTFGLLKSDAAKKRLTKAKERMQLPAARVVR